MPKRPKQIHLARAVPQEFFDLYQATSTSRSYLRALVNQYNNCFDDDVNAEDPFIDHTHARDLSDMIIAAQKKVQQCLEAMKKYSAATGINEDPTTSKTELDEKVSPKRRFMYTQDSEMHVLEKRVENAHIVPAAEACRRTPAKRVRFADLDSESLSLPQRGGSLLKQVTSGFGNLADSTCCKGVAPLNLDQPDAIDADALNEVSDQKFTRKRACDEDHYSSSSPTKLLKIWHENSWPEAYKFKDVGEGLDRPLSKAELDAWNTPANITGATNGAEKDADMDAFCCGQKLEPYVIVNKDRIVYRPKQKKTVTPKQEAELCQAADGEHLPRDPSSALTEVNVNAVNSRFPPCRVMKKLQLPCSAQASMLESHGALV